MKIIIIDNSDNSVHIYPTNVNPREYQTEDIEIWIDDNTEHRLSEISWMSLSDTFNITIH